MYRRLIIILIFIISIYCIAISPKISTFEEKNQISVEIKGEVNKPGVINLPIGSTIQDLINKVSLTDNADTSNFSNFEILHNNQIIVIPKKTNEDKISINSANLYELSALPGIGKSTALKIIEYRDEYGSFIKLEDLKNVSGIGNKKYEAIKQYICL